MSVIIFITAIISFAVGIFIGRDFPSKKSIKTQCSEELVRIEFLKDENSKKTKLIKERDTVIKLLEEKLTNLIKVDKLI